jgi:hypothetical protein
VPIDVRKLRPTELARLLNSTPLGEVTSERQLLRHRTRAGYRIGDGRTMDLFRYVAWLAHERRKPRPEPQGYEALKEQARARNAAISVAGRDIAPLPAVVDPERKANAFRNYQSFCDTYFPRTFHLPWSDDHLKVIRKIEEAVLHGGLFAMAMPRGSGKTTLAEVACIWAVLYGHREFVCLIGSDEGHAEDMLESIKTELDGNELLLEDFPEVVYPIQSLEGIANRASGQLLNGQRTHIGWTAREIILPTIPGSAASGAILRVAGLTGRIRGMKYKRPDGQSVRPSLVVLDDPQTDESARSLSQCATRESILAGAVLGLAGPGKKISGIMPCTVIRPGDMADNILSREKHPEWNGERTKMVYAFPANERLWQRYAELRAESLRQDRGGVDATEFYRANQAAMDEGASVAWPARFNHDELSAVQHAMNLKLQNEAAFFAEYQNEPLPEDLGEERILTADEISEKINRTPRRVVPDGAEQVTMFIDVQQSLLFYVVAAWRNDFTGDVIDYGTYPDQGRRYFTLRDARLTLGRAAPQAGLEGAIYAGLEALTGQMLGREWPREDGTLVRIDRCLVDANWGNSTDVVYQFCRQSAYAGILLPSHGRFVGASSIPFSDYKRKPGERVGLNWRITNVQGKRSIRHVVFDANFWKSFLHARLGVAMGDSGCLALYGQQPELHRLLAEHLTAEYRVRTTGRGRTVDEWKQRPERPDNHWFDCLVGCAVAASIQGAVLFGTESVAHARQRVSFAQLQQRRHS